MARRGPRDRGRCRPPSRRQGFASTGPEPQDRDERENARRGARTTPASLFYRPATPIAGNRRPAVRCGAVGAGSRPRTAPLAPIVRLAELAACSHRCAGPNPTRRRWHGRWRRLDDRLRRRWRRLRCGAAGGNQQSAHPHDYGQIPHGAFVSQPHGGLQWHDTLLPVADAANTPHGTPFPPFYKNVLSVTFARLRCAD
jgi:hypothetical protein